MYNRQKFLCNIFIDLYLSWWAYLTVGRGL